MRVFMIALCILFTITIFQGVLEREREREENKRESGTELADLKNRAGPSGRHSRQSRFEQRRCHLFAHSTAARTVVRTTSPATLW